MAEIESSRDGMHKETEILRHICDREIACKVYDVRIRGISVYDFVRQDLRIQYLRFCGVKSMDLVATVDSWNALGSAIISTFHILKLLLSSRKTPFLFLAFPRNDKVGTHYCDKFTDPFIDCSNVKDDDYVIFEAGRGGRHHRPRMHEKHIVYVDAITVFVRLASEISLFWGPRRYQKILTDLKAKIETIYDCELMSKRQIARLVIRGMLGVRCYEFLMKRIGARKVFSPVRPVCEFMAARHLGMDCYEMQHGVTYGESVLYSGYRDPMIVPNYFLAFGDNKPKSVYGIDEQRILNVGWPFFTYLLKESGNGPQHAKDVLVISDPEISDIMIGVVLELAEANPNRHFYLRPHPQEIYNQEQLKRIQGCPNVSVQDNRINIGVVLQWFDNIVGENSTVLYEALAARKKVGKLFWPGLRPVYLHEDDKDLFWEIHDLEDFSGFIAGESTDKNTRSIYSEFDKVLFNSLLI